ncbi:MAG TPA: hypothetical protein VME44_16075 [Streptosporangiaceae bacterium]|nr:hypothetical protein [Streptosporangiaceae bacterium]
MVDRLRCFGLHDLAEEALHELPDQVDTDQLWTWGMRHGVTKDELISHMGGSP